VAYNFPTGNNKTKLLYECKNVTRKVLFDNAVVTAFTSGRKYDVIPQDGVLWFFATKGKVVTEPIWKRSTFR
jgi:hypothetical protein